MPAVIVDELSWGDSNKLQQLTNSNGPWDLIILSDCIAHCYSDSFPGLIKTLTEACQTKPMKSFVLISYELRDKRDVQFFKLLGEANFKLLKIEDSKIDPDFRSDDIAIIKASLK